MTLIELAARLTQLLGTVPPDAIVYYKDDDPDVQNPGIPVTEVLHIPQHPGPHIVFLA